MGRTAKVRVLAGALGGAALAAAVAGCGSNTETSSIVSAPTQTSATTGKSAFVRQADAICAEANSAINALPATGSASSGAATVTQELETVKGQLQGLKSLGTPDSGGPQLERYLAALQDQLTALQHEAKAIQSGTSGVAATEVESATSAAQAAARAFGLRACAGSATPSGSASASASAPAAGAATGAATPTATAPAATATTPTAVTPVTPTTATPAPAPAPVPSGGTGTSTAGSGGSGGTGGVGVGGGGSP